jgi:hypothetical protein
LALRFEGGAKVYRSWQAVSMPLIGIEGLEGCSQ